MQVFVFWSFSLDVFLGRDVYLEAAIVKVRLYCICKFYLEKLFFLKYLYT